MLAEKAPDSMLSPRPRCRGNCCRCFQLELPFAEVQADYDEYLQNSGRSKIPDIDTIMGMLIHLGKTRGQDLFTCKHLLKNGDCSIYERRPQMCRDFPGPNPCPYRNCASHGPQPWWKRAWNWCWE